MQNFFFPKHIELQITAILAAQGCDDRDVARAVKRLSDYYLANPTGLTPWDKSWAQIAYLAYFLPLNYFRIRAVIARGQEVGFFQGYKSFLDFGSGLGSVALAFQESGCQFPKGGICVERSSEARKLHQTLQASTPHLLSWRGDVSKDMDGGPTSLAVFSYSLTELSKLPEWATRMGGLMVVEPATRQDGRNLLAMRENLLKEGWHVWAPCTHSDRCPLLHFSKKDWCHDRLEWLQPAFYAAIERHLPMKNKTLPFSYLLLRRSPPPMMRLARLTGDQQEFKGYTKQLVCRGSKREFLSWQHKTWKEVPIWRRGELQAIAPHWQQRGDEIRVFSLDGGADLP